MHGNNHRGIPRSFLDRNSHTYSCQVAQCELLLLFGRNRTLHRVGNPITNLSPLLSHAVAAALQLDVDARMIPDRMRTVFAWGVGAVNDESLTQVLIPQC